MLISPSFILTSTLVTIAPGPDILYVLSKGISHGKKVAVVAAAGFASGLIIHTSLVAFGISALLLASNPAFTTVKILGAAYLIYLGVRGFSSSPILALPSPEEIAPLRKNFAQAFLMNVMNPKVALFFIAFLPQFTSKSEAPVFYQLLILGFTFMGIAFSVFSTVGFFSSLLSNWMKKHLTGVRILNYLVSLMFILLGLKLALAKIT